MSWLRPVRLEREPRFWLAQGVWWLVTHLTIVARELAYDPDLFWRTGVAHYSFSFFLALGCSSVLALAYLAAPARWLTGGKSLLLVAAGCLGAAAVWNGAVCGHLLLATDYPVEKTREFALRGTFEFAKILVAWSALFLVVVQARRAAALREQELESASRAHRAELRSLRLHFNPAFVFDAIDSVFRSIGSDPERARALLREVASLLRRALKATRTEESSLGHTLELEESYLRCEAMRRCGRLRYRVDAPDSLRELPMSSLLLHPLVEDAVAHADGERGTRAVELAARAKDGLLQIDVRRTRVHGDLVFGGRGERLEAMRGQLQAAYPRSGTLTLIEGDGWVTTRVAFDPTESGSKATPRALITPASGPLPVPLSSGLCAVDPAVLRRPRFWLAQLAVGLVIYVSVFAWPFYAYVEADAPLLDLALVHGFGWLLAVLFSAVLVWACVRFPERWLTGGVAVPALLTLCLVFCVLWTAGVSTAYARSNLWFSENLGWDDVIELLFVGAGLFIAWTSLLLFGTISLELGRAHERILRIEALAHEAQLRSLRSQLHPHFLFNALSSVVPMIRLDPNAARCMLSDLARLLRRALEATRAEGITLEEELDFASQYLRCEATRFGDYLSVAVEVSGDLLDKPIPSMLLQPLVENAVKHGMAAERSHLCVTLTAAMVGPRLRIEVRNTGTLAGSTDELRGLGAGLRIVRERIATSYPGTGAFELVEEDGWVVARVTYEPAERPPSPKDKGFIGRAIGRYHPAPMVGD